MARRVYLLLMVFFTLLVISSTADLCFSQNDPPPDWIEHVPTLLPIIVTAVSSAMKGLGIIIVAMGGIISTMAAIVFNNWKNERRLQDAALTTAIENNATINANAIAAAVAASKTIEENQQRMEHKLNGFGAQQNKILYVMMTCDGCSTAAAKYGHREEDLKVLNPEDTHHHPVVHNGREIS